MLGVFRSKTANTIGLLPIKRLLRDFPRKLCLQLSINFAGSWLEVWQTSSLGVSPPG